MSNTQKIDDTIRKLDGRIQEEADPNLRQDMINDLQILFAERDALVGVDSTEGSSVEQQAIEGLREKKGDLAGFTSSLVTGLNRGILSIANLPFDIVNLALSAVGAPEEIRTANVSQAADFLSEKLTGYRPVEMATTPTAAVDTPMERMVGTIAEYASGGYGGGRLAKEAAEQVVKRTPTPAGGRSTLTQALTSPGFVRGETLAATGSGTLAAPAREYTESPYVETAAAVLGGVSPTVAPFLARGAKKQFIDPLTRSGAERRVANQLTEQAVDVDQAINNIATNQLVIKEALPEGTMIDPARLTEDEGILKTLGDVANNDPVIFSILERNRDKVSEEVFEELQSAASAGDSQLFLDTLNSKTIGVLDSLVSDIDLAQNQIAKIEGSIGPNSRGTEISQRFVAALEKSYQRAKKYEQSLWSLVDKTVPMNGKRFRLMGLRLRNQLKRKGFSDTDLSFFSEELPSFGARTGINNFEGLQRFRSRLLQQQREARAAGNNTKADALRRLDRLALQFIDSGPNSSSYRAAAEATRLISQSYNSGRLGQYLSFDSQQSLRIDPEAALDRVIRTGRNIGEVRRAIAAEQPLVNDKGQTVPVPPATGLTAPIKEMLALKFSEADTPAKRQKFFKQYEETLAEFPELARDLDSINTEIEVLAETIAKSEGRAKTATDKNVVSVAALIGADPENIIGSLQGLSRQKIKDIASVATQEGVESGMQTVFMQDIVSRMIGSGDSLKGLSSVLTSNKHLAYGFSDVLSPQQRKALSDLDKTRKLLQQNLGKTSSTTWFTQSSLATRILAKMSGVRLASVVAPSGPASLQTAALFSNLFAKVMDSLPSAQTRRVLIDALQDPKYFERLLNLERSEAALPQQIDQLNLILTQSGIRVPIQAERLIEEERRKKGAEAPL